MTHLVIECPTENKTRVPSNLEVNAALRQEGNRPALHAFFRGLVGSMAEETHLKFPSSISRSCRVFAHTKRDDGTHWAEVISDVHCVP